MLWPSFHVFCAVCFDFMCCSIHLFSLCSMRREDVVNVIMFLDYYVSVAKAKQDKWQKPWGEKSDFTPHMSVTFFKMTSHHTGFLIRQAIHRWEFFSWKQNWWATVCSLLIRSVGAMNYRINFDSTRIQYGSNDVWVAKQSLLFLIIL